MKSNNANVALKSFCMIIALSIGIASAAGAGEGRVIATCELVTVSTMKLFGHESRVTELRWRVNGDLVDYDGLRSVEKKHSERRYARMEKRSPSAMAGDQLLAKADSQNAKRRVLGSMQLVNKGNARLFGHAVAFNDIRLNVRQLPEQPPAYRLVKNMDGRMTIAHVDVDGGKKSSPLQDVILAFNGN